MFSEFSDAEFKAWIHILCTASVQNTNKPHVFFKHAERSAGVKRHNLLSAIDKLKILKVIQHPAVIRTDPVQDLFATEQNRTNKQRRQSVPDLHQLAEVWNQHCENLPKVAEWNAKRASLVKKLPENFGPSEMKVLTKRVIESDFLSGKVKKWRASFDWVLKKRVEILEGNYDNSVGVKPAQPSDSFCGVAD
jgi:hypothetical protein